MSELTLESLAARVAEMEQKQLSAEAAYSAGLVAASLTDIPELADNPWKDRFLEAMRENREQMAREDAAQGAAEDAATRQAG